MDPTIQALTINPADWAALIDGFVEGLGFGIVGLACLVVIAAALIAGLGRRSDQTGSSLDDLASPVWQSAALLGTTAPHELRGVVPMVTGPCALQAGRRRRRHVRSSKFEVGSSRRPGFSSNV